MTHAPIGAAIRLISGCTMILATPLMAQDPQWHSGITEPAADAILSIPASGIISQQHYNEGDTVSKGAVILELNHEKEALEVTRQTAVLESLKKDLERTRKLFETTNAISQEELDQIEDSVKIAEVDLTIAEVNLSQRKLVAPLSGIIADLYSKEEGEGVEIQAPLARVVDTSRCIFVCNVSEPSIKALKVNDPVTISINESATEGRIVFISPVIDPSSGLVEVKASFSNTGNRIRPGVAGTIQFSN